MKTVPLIRRSALAAAVASALLVMSPAFGQTTPPPTDPPAVVIEDRALRDRIDDRNLTLTTPLEVKDATGTTFLTLPVGTSVGRERLETRFAAEGVPIRLRTDLRDVTLQEATTVTNRATGEIVELPAGTVIRVKLDQRMDANGNIVRDRIDLRAVKPDGTRVRLRDRAPETQIDQVENEVENEVGDNHRQRGRDVAKPEDNSRSSSGRADRADRSGPGDRAGPSERSGRADRVERPDRSGRSERVERPERPERGGSGGHSGPG